MTVPGPVHVADADVIVVGGGILGTSAALALARRGREVTLVDEGSNPASRRSFAWLNAASATIPDYVALRAAGLLHHLVRDRGLVGRSPYRFSGSLAFDAADGTDAAPLQGEEGQRRSSLQDKLALLLSAGLPARAVSRAEAAEIEPGIDWRSAADPVLWTPLEGSVDLGALLDEQRGELAARGGRLLDGRAVLVHDGARTAVVIGEQRLRARTIVVAAGAETSSVLHGIGIVIPQRTNTGSLLTIPGAGGELRTIVRGPSVSLRSAGDGSLVAHSAAVDGVLERRGFEHAHRFTETPEVMSSVEHSVRAAESLLGRTLDLASVQVSAGARPIPADGLPVVGPVAEDVHVLFSHSGATLSLVLADLLAAVIEDRVEPEILRSFRAVRLVTRTSTRSGSL